VLSRRLGRLLTHLRVSAGKTHQDVVNKGFMARATLWRYEEGKTSPDMVRVRALAQYYGADAATIDAVGDLAKAAANAQAQWDESNVPDWFRLYVDLEAVADRILHFDGTLVPGFLQTSDYARAVYRTLSPDDGEDAVTQHVDLRLRRQASLFGRSPAPQLVAVLGEEVVTRPVGGEQVIAAQVQHLRDVAASGQVDVRIVPRSVGAYAAMIGPFRIFECAHELDPDVVYVESQIGGRYYEKPSEVATYRRVFDLTIDQAVPIKEYR